MAAFTWFGWQVSLVYAPVAFKESFEAKVTSVKVGRAGDIARLDDRVKLGEMHGVLHSKINIQCVCNMI